MSHSNPYASKGQEVSAEELQPSKLSRRLRMALMIGALLLALLFSAMAFQLITQAVEFSSKIELADPRLRAGMESISRSSWIGGGVSLLAVLMSLVALVLAKRNQLAVSAGLVIASFLSIVAVAIVAAPS